MTITDEGSRLREEVAKLPSGRTRRYPDDLRRRLLAWVGRATRSGWPVVQCARSLGMRYERLRIWSHADEPSTSLALVPVTVDRSPTASSVLVITPGGHRVEGLTFAQVRELVTVLP